MSDWKDSLIIPIGYRVGEITKPMRMAFKSVDPKEGLLLFSDSKELTVELALVRSDKTIMGLNVPEFGTDAQNMKADKERNQSHNARVTHCVYSFLNLNTEFIVI